MEAAGLIILWLAPCALGAWLVWRDNVRFIARLYDKRPMFCPTPRGCVKNCAARN